MVWLLVFTGILLYAAYTDHKTRQIQNWISILLLVVAIIYTGFWWTGLIGMITASVIGIIFWKQKFFGGADAKLFIPLGYFWGWLFFLVFLLLLSLFVISRAGILRAQKKRLRPYALAPYMLYAHCIVVAITLTLVLFF